MLDDNSETQLDDVRITYISTRGLFYGAIVLASAVLLYPAAEWFWSWVALRVGG